MLDIGPSDMTFGLSKHSFHGPAVVAALGTDTGSENGKDKNNEEKARGVGCAMPSCHCGQVKSVDLSSIQ